MELAKNYSPKEVESKWYEYWNAHKLFSSKPDSREPYTIVIPPPNVTGVLHMGHMLNNTIQDILIRKARLDGKNALYCAFNASHNDHIVNVPPGFENGTPLFGTNVNNRTLTVPPHSCAMILLEND